jgi:hypothetical protein
MMNLFRRVYRFPPVEIVLLICVAIQIVSGLILVFKKGSFKQPFYVTIQILSGLYISFFKIYHILAVMTGRYKWNVETDFHFAAGVANHYPEKLFFISYYALSVACVFVHAACAHYQVRMRKLGRMQSEIDVAILNKMYKTESIIICITGMAITSLIMFAMTGVL